MHVERDMKVERETSMWRDRQSQVCGEKPVTRAQTSCTRGLAAWFSRVV